MKIPHLILALIGTLSPALAADSSTPAVLRIGYQKFNTLNILKARGSLEKRLEPLGVKVSWHQFGTGPLVFEALNAGSIDFGHSADAGAAFAQAAGVPFVYIAVEPPYPKGIALVVPKDSPIHDVAGLKGKSIAYGRGWNVHYGIARALEEAGLNPQRDIKPAYIKNAADAFAVLESKAADAVGLWDPFLAVAEKKGGVRVLRNGEGIAKNYTFLVAGDRYAKDHAGIIRILLDELATVDDWANQNPKAVAELLAPELGIDPAALELATRRRLYGVHPVSPRVVSDQQQLADTYFRLGELPKQIHVADLVQGDFTPASAGKKP